MQKFKVPLRLDNPNVGNRLQRLFQSKPRHIIQRAGMDGKKYGAHGCRVADDFENTPQPRFVIDVGRAVHGDQGVRIRRKLHIFQ